MDCPGEYLKRERELREISLDDISSEIKVSVKLLRALEADDYQSLPHTAFVKGYIKAYCKFLGLDGNEALLRYELYLQEIAEFEEPAKKPKSLDVAERSYPVRKFLTLFLVVIGVIIIVGVYYLGSAPDDKSGDKVAGKESGKVAEKATRAIEATNDKPPAAAYVKKVERDGAFKVEVRVGEATPGAETVEIAKKSEAPLAQKSVVESTAIDAPKEVTKVEGPEVVEPAAKPAKPFDLASVGLGAGEHLLRAHATALTWIKVTIDSNTPFEVMLQPDERVQWRGKVFFCS